MGFCFGEPGNFIKDETERRRFPRQGHLRRPGLFCVALERKSAESGIKEKFDALRHLCSTYAKSIR